MNVPGVALKFNQLLARALHMRARPLTLSIAACRCPLPGLVEGIQLSAHYLSRTTARRCTEVEFGSSEAASQQRLSLFAPVQPGRSTVLLCASCGSTLHLPRLRLRAQ